MRAGQPSRRLYCLAKIGARQYMEELYREGIVFLQRWQAYKTIEAAERGDKFEGLTNLFQPSPLVELTIGGKRIDPEKIAAPLQLSTTWNPYVYCMYGIYERDVTLGKPFNFDKRCYEFGDTVVGILNVDEFIRRVSERARDVGFDPYQGPVEYVDYHSHNGEVGPFRKMSTFEHQREFRFVFDNPDIADETFRLEIGSLEDIAGISPISEEFIFHDSRSKRIGRNDPCMCGSGRKYKYCCL